MKLLTSGGAITKLVMRAAGDQVKTACGSLKLCAGIEAGIEGVTHAVVQRRRERNTQESEGGAGEVSEGGEEERMAAPGGLESAEGAEKVVEIGKVPRPSGERRIVEEGGEGRATNSEPRWRGWRWEGSIWTRGRWWRWNNMTQMQQGGGWGGPAGTGSHRTPGSG